MNLNAFEEFSRIFAPYIFRDRSRYLSSLSSREIFCGSPLDFQHQSILRIALENTLEGGPEKVSGYIKNHRDREHILKTLQETYISNDVSTRTSSSIAAGMRYVDDPSDSLIAAIGCAEKLCSVKTLVYFVNDAGFGVFRKICFEELGPDLPVMLATGSQRSLGAAMYYAFNTTSETSYLQTDSIRVLAATLSSMYESSSPTLELVERNILFALRHSHGFFYGNDSLLEGSLMKMFALHECGHRVEHPGNQYLRDFLLSHGLPDSCIYKVAFPSPTDLGAWSRIQLGAGTLSDVLFVLGDTLANVAFLQLDPDESVLAALRIFLAWLVRPLKRKSCPRGNSPLLLCLLDGNLPSLVKQIYELLEQCMKTPNAAADILRKFEGDAWERLSVRLKQS
jgi:hypothetical protein